MEIPEQDFRRMQETMEAMQDHLRLARQFKEIDTLIIAALCWRLGGDVTLEKKELLHVHSTYSLDESSEITKVMEEGMDGKVRFKLRVK